MSGQGEKSKLRIHEFRHRGNTYQVYLEGLDGELFATVYAPNGLKRPLVPFPDEIPSRLSPPAIRMGYIAVAEWLVKNTNGRMRRPEPRCCGQRIWITRPKGTL